MASIITENGFAVAAVGAVLVVGVMGCCGAEKDGENDTMQVTMNDRGKSNGKKKNQEPKAKKAQKEQKEPNKEPKSKAQNDKEVGSEEVSKKSKKGKGKAAEEPKEVVAADSKKKRRNKKSKGGNGGDKAPEPTKAPKEEEEVVSTDVAEAPPTVTPSQSTQKKQNSNSNPIEAGWTTVEVSKKEKKWKEAMELPVEPEAASPVLAVDAVAAEESAPAEVKPILPSNTVSVDPRKIGIVIGPKGATMKRIEELTGCRLRTQDQDPAIQVKSAHISVEGPDAESVREACRLVTDLCSKGYSAKLQGGDFTESSMDIPARSVHELVGSGGVVIKALRDGTGTIINLPPQKKLATGSADKMVKVSIAGPKAGVEEAKEAINDILTKYYSTVTHPGFTHASFELADWQIARFCGKGGSNIKHIQGDSKARVHIPRDNAEKKNVLVVGTAHQVAIAKKHVNRILEDIKEEANRISSEENFASAHRANKADDDDDEPHEEWMDEFLYKR